MPVTLSRRKFVTILIICFAAGALFSYQPAPAHHSEFENSDLVPKIDPVTAREAGPADDSDDSEVEERPPKETLQGGRTGRRHNKDTETQTKTQLPEIEETESTPPEVKPAEPQKVAMDSGSTDTYDDPDDDPDQHIHVVFPSGCNAFQQWQAELVLHSHLQVGQKGKITRIVHGCEDNSEIKNMAHLPHPGGKSPP